MIQLGPCQLVILDFNCPMDGKAQANTLGWFSFLYFFFKKAPKLYGFKEAPEKHKFISVHVVKQELSSHDQGLAFLWDCLSAALGRALRRFCPVGPARRDTGHGRPGSVGPIPVPVW